MTQAQTAYCDVVIYNDNTTPSGFVAGLLRHVTGLSQYDCEELARRVERIGRHALGPYPEKVAFARPGRIDQLIEFPKPDDDCRRRLMQLYGGKLRLSAELEHAVVSRTDGVSAAFIKELMRRLAQYSIEREDDGTSVLRGPNIYGLFPVIQQVLDLGVLDRWPTVRLGDAFIDSLVTSRPGLAEHGCSYREPGGLSRRMRDDFIRSCRTCALGPSTASLVIRDERGVRLARETGD